MIGQTISQYRVLAKLGEGGMGVVYKARDTKLDRDVALKFLPSHLAASEQDKERFVQEAKAASALNHPNVCTIHDIQQRDQQLFIVMEFVDGQTLREKKETVSFKQAVDIGIQIAEGLAAAHEKGIVHRDIKPENIMIRKDGIAQIMDFGLAKLHGVSRLTKEGSTVGTAGYMSPEQVQGQDADHRSDIFSLGVLLYELCTGQLPFKGVHETALAYEIVNVDPAPMSTMRPEIDPSLDAIVLECLAKDADERYQSAKELAKDLRRFKRESSRTRVSRLTAAMPAYHPTSDQHTTGTSAAGVVPSTGRSAKIAWLITTLAVASLIVIGVLNVGRTVLSPPVIRTSILPAAHTSVLETGGLALSPDGSMLAYVAEDSGGNTRLWIRALRSMTALPLPGTEDAFHPFWSPDNRFIGFFAEGKLKKVEASGGSVFSICDAAGPTGGSWNSDGTIIFASMRQIGISRVSAQGGSPVLINAGDTTSYDLFYLSPCFLEDGRHFLYSTYTKPMVVAARTNDNAVYIGSLDSDERRLLVARSSNAVVANGYLIFVRDNMLVAQPFSPDKFELTGDQATIAEQVQYSERYGVGSFTVSQTGVLAYQSRISNLDGQLVFHARTGAVLQTIGQKSSYDDPALSPDGTRLAFTLYEGAGSRGDIWIAELSRGTMSRFTFDAAEEDDPVWSSDGTKMVFSHEGDLALKPANGTGSVEFLYRSKGDKVPTDWSRDGKYLLFGDFGGKTGRDIWVLPMTAERKPMPFAMTEFAEQGGHFSPDGRLIAYSSNETRRHEIYVQSFPASSGKWQISTQGGVLPKWGLNGLELYYVDLNNQLMAVEISSTGSSLQAGTPRVLFRTSLVFVGGPGHRYDVSGDGQRFIFNDLTETELQAEPLNLVINWPAELQSK